MLVNLWMVLLNNEVTLAVRFKNKRTMVVLNAHLC